MEVPQLVYIKPYYYLLFSVPPEHHSAARQARLETPPVGGTHYLVSENPLGPFRYVTDAFMVGDSMTALYSGKLIQAADASWQFMAFRNNDPVSGHFIGDLADPIPVAVRADGRIIINAATSP